MRLQLTVTYRAPSTAGLDLTTVDVEVDAAQGSTADELVTALADHLGLTVAPDEERPRPADTLSLVVAGRAVAASSSIGQPPLLDGASASLVVRGPLQDSATRAMRTPRATIVLAVVHGPDCGRTVDLHPGRHTIGRSDGADIRLEDSRLSRLHAEICVNADGVTLRDLGSTNGTRVDTEAVSGDPVPVTTASTIHLGDSIVVLRHPGAVPAAVTVTGDGTLAVNRRPRVLEDHRPARVVLPTPPTPPRRTRVPWVAVLLPLPVAAVLALFAGPTMLAFALMGPVLMVGTALSDRWGSRRTYAVELASYETELALVRERLTAACSEEARALARANPDAAAVLAIAAGPTERLWERGRHDADALSVTIGRCRRDASVQLSHQGAEDGRPAPQLEDAPCSLSLQQIGVLGLCGDRAAVTATARQLVGQLVTLHPPTDLQVVALLRGDDALEEWSWLWRVPHCRNAFGDDRGVRAPTGNAGAAAARLVVATVASTIRDRLASPRSTAWQGPTTLVLVDGTAALRGAPDLATVLADGPGVGVLCLALDADRSALPHEAGAILDLRPGRPPELALPGHHHDDFVADGVGSFWAERLGRSLAPLRDASPTDGPSVLPAAIGLLALGSPLDPLPGHERPRTVSAGPDPTTGSDAAALRDPATLLAQAWRRRPHCTSVPLGVVTTGTFTIDLASDGPHVLVGGTTGAGKSELLRTLVASLALHNTPAHLSFVLIDYKGGAAFRDCADLPHVAGIVTDLDEHLAARALTSLTAEVTRRERLLRDAGSPDFLSYQSSPQGSRVPLARLVVVVDEFRALAEELPAFVDGLVRLASLGRSLGIHLVLATQRPAGVVTADIRANVNLRIALRVRDRVDSEDVVDSPLAAFTDPATPGRAHARSGGSALVEFQAAHVGAPLRTPRARSVEIRRCRPGDPTRRTTSEELLGEAPAPDGRATELATIVDTIRAAVSGAGLRPAPAAWLPPLPTHLSHASLEEPTDRFTAHLGLVDVPEQQRQEPLAFDLRTRGHWAIVGSPGSGRSTTLVTLARSLCGRSGPDQLHVYAVSAGSLAGLGGLPQVGACIDWSDGPRVERLVARLTAEVAIRRAALSRRGGTTIADWWAADDADTAPPPMLLLVDDWDMAAGRNDDLAVATLVERLLALLREGEPVGLTSVLAGDRSLLLGRAGAAAAHRVVLRLPDPTDAVLLGLAPREVAALHCPGRGLTSDGHPVQLALPAGDPSRPWAAAPTTSPRSPASTRGPLRVDALPSTVHEDDLDRGALRPGTITLGIGGDDCTVLGLDPERDGRRWLVTGAAGSGVSTTLLVAAKGLLAAGRPLAVVAHRSGPLDTLQGQAGVVAWCDGTDTTALVRARRDVPSLVVVVDGTDELLDRPVEAALSEIGHLADKDGGLLVLGAGSGPLSSMYRGVAIEAARHRTGVLLGPATTADARLFGVQAPVDRHPRPGRGHVVRRGVAIPVQVALPSPRSPRSLATGLRGSVTA